jgi:hypothetical protein
MRPSMILYILEESYCEWLLELRHPTEDRRYDVSQLVMRGHSLNELRALSREELDIYLDKHDPS